MNCKYLIKLCSLLIYNNSWGIYLGWLGCTSDLVIETLKGEDDVFIIPK